MIVRLKAKCYFTGRQTYSTELGDEFSWGEDGALLMVTEKTGRKLVYPPASIWALADVPVETAPSEKPPKQKPRR